MSKTDIKEFILDLLGEKLALFDINRSEVKNDFDLVKSGLLDSMAFIDMVAEVEDEFDVEIDFEETSEKDDITSLGGLVKIIKKADNA